MNQSASIPATGNGEASGRTPRGGAGDSAVGGGSRFEAMLRGQIADGAPEPQAAADARAPTPASAPASDGSPEPSSASEAPPPADEVTAPGDGAGVVATNPVAPADGIPVLPPALEGLFLDPAAALAGGANPGDALAAQEHLVPLLPVAVDVQATVAAPAPATPVVAVGEVNAPAAPAEAGTPVPVVLAPVDAAASAQSAQMPGAVALAGAAGQAAAAGSGVTAQDARGRGAPAAPAQPQGTAVSSSAAARDASAAPTGQGAVANPGAGGADPEFDFQQALDGATRGGGDSTPGQPRAAAGLSGLAAAPATTGGGTATAAVPRHALVLDHALGAPGWDAALGARMAWSVNNGVQAASLDLNPRDLGPVNVQLSVHDDEVSLSFVSQHAAVREAIEAALPRLRELLAGGGFELGGVQISADSGHAGAGGDAAGKDAGNPAAGRDGDAAGADATAGAHATVRLADGLVDTFA